MAVVADIDHFSSAITHGTAPAFMLGAVAGFLSILVRESNESSSATAPSCWRGGRSSPDGSSPSLGRGVRLLSNAIYFAVLSALVTATLLIATFIATILGISHGGIVAVMFMIALALLIASLVQSALEIRLHSATMRLD